MCLFGNMFSFLLGTFLGVGWLGHMVGTIFQSEHSSCATSLSTLGKVGLFNFNHSCIFLEVSHWILICISLKMILNIFICLLSIYLSYLVKCPLKYFACFLNHIICWVFYIYCSISLLISCLLVLIDYLGRGIEISNYNFHFFISPIVPLIFPWHILNLCY